MTQDVGHWICPQWPALGRGWITRPVTISLDPRPSTGHCRLGGWCVITLDHQETLLRTKCKTHLLASPVQWEVTAQNLMSRSLLALPRILVLLLRVHSSAPTLLSCKLKRLLVSWMGWVSRHRLRDKNSCGRYDHQEPQIRTASEVRLGNEEARPGC